MYWYGRLPHWVPENSTVFVTWRLELIPEAQAEHRIKLERPQAVVDIGLFQLDVVLHRGIGADRQTSADRIVGARAAGQIQLGVGGALVDYAKIEIDREMPHAAREQVAEPDQQLGRDLSGGDGCRAADRADVRAVVSDAVERKGLASRNRGARGPLVAIVNHHAGTDVEAPGYVLVIEHFGGFQPQCAIVSDVVAGYAATVPEIIDTKPHVRTARHGGGGLNARAQCSGAHLDSESGQPLTGGGTCTWAWAAGSGAGVGLAGILAEAQSRQQPSD